MRRAEHLTVRSIGYSTLTPRRDVIGFHRINGPDLGLVCIVANRIERAIRLPGLLRFSGLFLVDLGTRSLIEHPNLHLETDTNSPYGKRVFAKS